MSDRGVFVAAFLTAVLIVAGAFVLTDFFYFELMKSTIYIAIAVMVFFGEDRYSYMLGILAPLVWFLADFAVGERFQDYGVLLSFFRGQEIPPLETPLHGFARLSAILLIVLSYRVWKKQVSEKFFGKTYWTCVVISVIYSVIVGVWFVRATSGGG